MVPWAITASASACPPSSVFGSSFYWYFKATRVQNDYTDKDFLKGYIHKSQEDTGCEMTQFNPQHVYLGNLKTLISETVRISEDVNQPDLHDMSS